MNENRLNNLSNTDFPCDIQFVWEELDRQVQVTPEFLSAKSARGHRSCIPARRFFCPFLFERKINRYKIRQGH